MERPRARQSSWGSRRGRRRSRRQRPCARDRAGGGHGEVAGPERAQCTRDGALVCCAVLRWLAAPSRPARRVAGAPAVSENRASSRLTVATARRHDPGRGGNARGASATPARAASTSTTSRQTAAHALPRRVVRHGRRRRAAADLIAGLAPQRPEQREGDQDGRKADERDPHRPRAQRRQHVPEQRHLEHVARLLRLVQRHRVPRVGASLKSPLVRNAGRPSGPVSTRDDAVRHRTWGSRAD